MGNHDFTGDGKPKSRACADTGSLVEALEDMFNLVLRDSWAFISHREFNPCRTSVSYAQTHRGPLRSVFQRVVEKVRNHLLQSVGVAWNAESWLNLRCDSHALLVSPEAEDLSGVVDHITNTDRVRREDYLASLNPGQVKKLVHLRGDPS